MKIFQLKWTISQLQQGQQGVISLLTHLTGVQLVPEPQGAVVDQLVAPQFFKRLLEIS